MVLSVPVPGHCVSFTIKYGHGGRLSHLYNVFLLPFLRGYTYILALIGELFLGRYLKMDGARKRTDEGGWLRLLLTCESV